MLLTATQIRPIATVCPSPAPDQAEALLVRVAELLHAYGTPAHRLERLLARMSYALGLDAEFLSTPTSLLAAFGTGSTQRTRLLRVEPGEEVAVGARRVVVVAVIGVLVALDHEGSVELGYRHRRSGETGVQGQEQRGVVHRAVAVVAEPAQDPVELVVVVVQIRLLGRFDDQEGRARSVRPELERRDGEVGLSTAGSFESNTKRTKSSASPSAFRSAPPWSCSLTAATMTGAAPAKDAQASRVLWILPVAVWWMWRTSSKTSPSPLRSWYPLAPSETSIADVPCPASIGPA